MQGGMRVLYVSQSLNVAANESITSTYFADLDAFEFVFATPATVDDPVQISVWGKSSTGQLVTAHRLVSAELLGDTGVTGATGATRRYGSDRCNRRGSDWGDWGRGDRGDRRDGPDRRDRGNGGWGDRGDWS